jgi:hypothetical protein
LAPLTIADKLGVDRSTVQRWMAAGRITDTRESQASEALLRAATDVPWAAAIRAAYTLDATDEKLVALADLALTVAQTTSELPSIRLAAAGRFQSLVKQLAARIRPTAETQPAATPRAVTVRADPRSLLIQ